MSEECSGLLLNKKFGLGVLFLAMWFYGAVRSFSRMRSPLFLKSLLGVMISVDSVTLTYNGLFGRFVSFIYFTLGHMWHLISSLKKY